MLTFQTPTTEPIEKPVWQAQAGIQMALPVSVSSLTDEDTSSRSKPSAMQLAIQDANALLSTLGIKQRPNLPMGWQCVLFILSNFFSPGLFILYKALSPYINIQKLSQTHSPVLMFQQMEASLHSVSPNVMAMTIFPAMLLSLLVSIIFYQLLAYSFSVLIEKLPKRRDTAI